MSAATFTPGPWHVWAGAIYQGTPGDEDGDLVFLPLEAGSLMDDIKNGEWDDHQSAKPEDLILAAAAPELLAAAQWVVDGDECDCIKPGSRLCGFCRLTDAIAKAVQS